MALYWLKHGGTRFPIHRGRCVLGRGRHCFVILTGRRVSREHAEIRVVRGRLQIADLGSRNGTVVNGQTIAEPRTLSSGDVVEVGDERLEIQEQKSSELPATLRISDTDDESLVFAQRNVLELAEELMMTTARGDERSRVALTIRAMLDGLLESIARSGRKPARGEAVRLVAVAQIVAGWLDSEELQDWSRQLTETLAD